MVKLKHYTPKETGETFLPCLSNAAKGRASANRTPPHSPLMDDNLRPGEPQFCRADQALMRHFHPIKRPL